MKAWNRVRKFTKSKILFIAILIIVSLSSLGGIFLLLGRETPPEAWSQAEMSISDDYIVKEHLDGVVIENKKVGLSFKVPKDWKVERPSTGVLKSIRINNPGAVEKSPAIMADGCRIIPVVLYLNTNTQAIKREVEISIWNSYLSEIKEKKVNGKDGLIYIAESSDLSFFRSEILIPVKATIFSRGKVYSLALDAALKNKDKCVQEFEKILDTLVID